MFVAVDKDGNERIYGHKPKRYITVWHGLGCVVVPKGTIQRLLYYPLTWDDEAEEIVEYKDKDLKEFKMIKQNIEMRVTPEQSRKIQEICFENGVEWLVSCKLISYLSKPCLIIENYTITYRDYGREFEHNSNIEEIDADLFIRTSGTCEENSTLNDNSISFKDEEYIKLEKKVFNLRKQLEKHAIKIDNQKEELTRLLNQKKQLNNRLDIYALCNDNQKIKITNLLAQKEELQSQLNMANKAVRMSIDTDIKLIRLLEEKDEIIKYLENKLAKKTNEAYEKKVMSFEELYIKQADEYYKKVEDKVMGFVKKNLKRELNN